MQSQGMVDLSAAAAEQQANSTSLQWIKRMMYGPQAANAAIMHLVYSVSVEQVIL